jgi:transcriptional antiterminator RfaH
MNWYLLHTKPRQEKIAVRNLAQQGYECYLPLMPLEKISRGTLVVSEEPLFPRYLFIYLDTNESAKSWGPIRYTRGVNRLVSFGSEPAKVDMRLVQVLKSNETALLTEPQPLFKLGEKVTLKEGPFSGIEAIYQMPEGESRAIVLIELLSKPTKLSVSPVQLRKLG